MERDFANRGALFMSKSTNKPALAHLINDTLVAYHGILVARHFLEALFFV
jgi:hypothetical protein